MSVEQNFPKWFLDAKKSTDYRAVVRGCGCCVDWFSGEFLGGAFRAGASDNRQPKTDNPPESPHA